MTPSAPRPVEDHPVRPERSWRRVLALAAVAWLLLCGAVVAWGRVLTRVLDDTVGRVDDELARDLAAQRTGGLTDLAELAVAPGDTVTSQVLLLAAAVTAAVARRSWVPLAFVALVDVGLVAVYLIATHLDPRVRPPVPVLDPGLVPDHSFPSGHVATAVAACSVPVALGWLYTRWGRWLTPLLLLPVGTALGRLYQGAHHLSDVLTSLCYAPVWVLLLAVLFRPRAAPRTSPPP